MSIETFLNHYQLSIADDKKQYFHTDTNPKLIWGSSGSGKSTLMLYRNAYLMDVENYAYNEILNIVGHKEMMLQCQKQFQTLFPTMECPRFIDIYSFAYMILKKDAIRHNKSVRKVFKDCSNIIIRLCKDFFNIELTKEQALILQNEIFIYQNAAKKDLMTSEIEGIDLKLLNDEYQAMKKRKDMLDYNDVLWEGIHILRTQEELLQDYQKQYRCIQVDDGQNLSYAAHVLLNLLKGNHELIYYANQDIMMIQEDDVLLNFEKIYANGRVYTLKGHYRCSEEIWEKACEFKKGLKNETLSQRKGNEVKFKNFTDISRLYTYAYQKSGDDVDTAFLYRHFAMAVPLIELLYTKEIPFKLQGNMKHFTQDKMVNDLWNIISILIDPRDIRSFYEVYRLLGFDISKRILQEIAERIQNEPNVDVYQAMMESNMKQAGKQRLGSLIENIRIAETLTSEEMIPFIIEKLDYGLYIQIMNRSVQDPVILALLAIAKRYPKPDEFTYRISKLNEIKANQDAKILIASYDDVKSLEFDRVYMLDCIKGIVPRVDNMKERNAFYDAMTRAKQELEFFTTKQAGNIRLFASSYLFELHGKKNEVVKEVQAKKKLKQADLKAGMKILHANFGEGVIKKVNVSMIQIQFKEETKVLNTKLCIQNQWLSLIQE